MEEKKNRKKGLKRTGLRIKNIDKNNNYSILETALLPQSGCRARLIYADCAPAASLFRRMIRLRKYLLPEGGKFYKANLHCHTTISDGDLTDKELKKAYKEQGYSVVAFTDHDICVPHHELTDKDFVALTAYEADISNWIVDDSNFVRCYHFNCYATTDGDGYSTVPKPGYGSIDAINDYISRLRDAGYIVCYNHPNWSLQTFEDYGGLKGLFAMEIFNYSAMLDGIDANHEMQYDALLRGGNRLFCVATDDNHNRSPFSHPLCDSFGGFAMIKADSLSYGSVIEALKRGDFYASMGPEIHSLYTEDGNLCIKCSGVRSIHMTTGGRRTEVARVHDGETLSEARFYIDPKDVYVRVQITDNSGRRANTNAYFIDEIL